MNIPSSINPSDSRAPWNDTTPDLESTLLNKEEIEDFIAEHGIENIRYERDCYGADIFEIFDDGGQIAVEIDFHFNVEDYPNDAAEHIEGYMKDLGIKQA